MRCTISSEFHPGDKRWFTAPWRPEDPEWAFKLSRRPSLVLENEEPGGQGETTIRVDHAKTDQAVTGIGTSLDETSCYAIQKGKDDRQIKELLRRLIDPQAGAGYSLFRVCFGTSDFSDARAVSRHPNGWYTYQDDKDGEFSIENDRKLGILRVLKLARDVARECGTEVKFFGSAWSPPAWMKIGGRIAEGNRDRNQLRGDMAGAMPPIRKAVQAYEAEGIPIWAITTGNEHLYTPDNYPGCFIPQEVEAKVVVALHKEFAENKLATRIWIHDHNWDLVATGPERVLGLLKDARFGPKGEAYRFVDAVALHHYGGSPGQMVDFRRKFPDMPLEFTEGSVWGARGMDEIVQIFRTGHRSYVSWVPMSTQDPTEHNQGPYNTVDALGPTLLIQASGQGPSWYVTPEYFLIAQFSKFVRPGAIRIESTAGTPETVTNVAFRNPDGTTALVVVNQTTAEQAIRILVASRQARTVLPARSVATYVFRLPDRP